MANVVGDLLVQAGYYFIVMLITIGLMGIIQKGFFWPYIKVRASFGRLVLVKLRAINIDYFRAGRIDAGFLVFKDGKDEKRIHIDKPSTIYRSVGGTNWIDVDAESSSIMEPDLTGVTGFDAEKYQNLYIRALTRPAITDNKDKILIGGVFLLVVLIAIVGFLVFKQGVTLEQLPGMISSLNRGVVVAGG